VSSNDPVRDIDGYSAGGEQRAAPQYCPYCGDEDLRPDTSSRRSWNCRACARVFEVSFVGLKLGAGA
jgi:ribosomal protein L37AE/L43A